MPMARPMQGRARHGQCQWLDYAPFPWPCPWSWIICKTKLNRTQTMTYIIEPAFPRATVVILFPFFEAAKVSVIVVNSIMCG